MKKPKAPQHQASTGNASGRAPGENVAPFREELIADLTRQAASIVRSDSIFKDLQSLKKVFPLIYELLQKERRRKTPSPVSAGIK